MSEYEIVIPLNNAYNETIIVSKYGDQYSLILGYAGKEGSNGMKWCYPQYSNKPREKAVPWKIPLGNRVEAVEVIKKIAKAFGLGVAGSVAA